MACSSVAVSIRITDGFDQPVLLDLVVRAAVPLHLARTVKKIPWTSTKPTVRQKKV